MGIEATAFAQFHFALLCFALHLEAFSGQRQGWKTQEARSWTASARLAVIIDWELEIYEF